MEDLTEGSVLTESMCLEHGYELSRLNIGEEF